MNLERALREHGRAPGYTPPPSCVRGARAREATCHLARSPTFLCARCTSTEVSPVGPPPQWPSCEVHPATLKLIVHTKFSPS